MEDITIHPIITLHDAITDSPIFRSRIYRQDAQLEQLEQWLDLFARQLKLYAEKLEKLNMETLVLCQKALPKDIDGTLIDSNFAAAIMKSFSDALLATLSFKTKLISDLEECLIKPLQQFVKTHLRDFKNFRKQFAKVLERYEVQLSKYSALSKTKEPSSIREEAFRLHEARKEYVRMSGQNVIRILNFRSLLEHSLVENFSSVSIAHKDFYNDIQVRANLDATLSFWKQWLSDDKITSSYQLRKQQIARKRLEEEYIRLTAPDHDLVTYTSTPTPPPRPNLSHAKWGYLFQRVSRLSWTRKWFFIESGYFGVCQIDTTGKQKYVIQCETRLDLTSSIIQPIETDRRFCFEIIHPDHPSFILQAETEGELQDWMRAFGQRTGSIMSLETSGGFVSVSTTPGLDITLERSASLTPWLVPVRSEGSWGIPWSLMPTSAAPLSFPAVVWPPKIHVGQVEDVTWEGYGKDLNMVNKELRSLFGGVRPDEVVLCRFVCCLRRKGVDSSANDEKEIEKMSVSTIDAYEKEIAQQLKSQDFKPPSDYGYAYIGNIYITQDTFWFYSCVMTTCIHSIAVRLKDIDEIKVFRDQSLKPYMDENLTFSKSDMAIAITIIPNTSKETENPIVFGISIESIELIAEKLKLAVRNAKQDKPLAAKDIFHEIKVASVPSEPNTMGVLDLPLTYDGGAHATPNSSKTRVHAATVGPEAKINAIEILKNYRLRGESEPTRPLSKVQLQPPKKDPDMPPLHVECPDSCVDCGCDDHPDRKEAQVNLPISAKRCFELMFSDEQNAPPTDGGVWQSKVMALEGHDLSVTKWNRVNGKMQRTLKYWTSAATAKVARVKEAETIETQTIITKEDYIRYTVQSQMKTPALQYSEAYIPSVRYCITWVNKSECQLTFYTNIRWIKSVLVRAIITRTILKHLSDSVALFIPIIKESSKSIKKRVDQTRLEVIEHNKNLLQQAIQSDIEHREQTVQFLKDTIESQLKEPEAVEKKETKSFDLPAQENFMMASFISLRDTLISSAPSSSSNLVQSERSIQTQSNPLYSSEQSEKSSIAKNKSHPIMSGTNRVSTFFLTSVTTHVVTILILGIVFYIAGLYMRSDINSTHIDGDSELSNSTIHPIPLQNNCSCKPPVEKKHIRSVYLRDLEEGFTQNIAQPPFVNSRSYHSFLQLRRLEYSRNTNGSTVYNHQWFSKDHHHLALDLSLGRERIAVLRHDLLVTFQVLNALDAHLVENEFTNWLMDTQLKCNTYPPPKDEKLFKEASALCKDIDLQLKSI